MRVIETDRLRERMGALTAQIGHESVDLGLSEPRHVLRQNRIDGRTDIIELELEFGLATFFGNALGRTFSWLVVFVRAVRA